MDGSGSLQIHHNTDKSSVHTFYMHGVDNYSKDHGFIWSKNVLMKIESRLNEFKGTPRLIFCKLIIKRFDLLLYVRWNKIVEPIKISNK